AAGGERHADRYQHPRRDGGADGRGGRPPGRIGQDAERGPAINKLWGRSGRVGGNPEKGGGGRARTGHNPAVKPGLYQPSYPPSLTVSIAATFIAALQGEASESPCGRSSVGDRHQETVGGLAGRRRGSGKRCPIWACRAGRLR